jgi:hypothetical protein
VFARTLTAVTAALALTSAAVAQASNGPVPGPGPVAGPCVETAKLNGSAYTYGLCGVPDLDQVRVTAGSFVGLPGNGHNYCAPTSTTNLFAYLATKGFVNDPAVKDYLDPANFNEASQDINQLGDLMGTTAASGTGGGGMLDGITQWLLQHGTPKIKIAQANSTTLDIVTKSFTTGNYYSPDISAMAQDALNGGLVVGVVGFYGQATDPATGVAHLQRFGGHLVSVVAAQGMLGSNATTLGVHDPATTWIDDDVQTPYATDQWVLSAGQQDTYYYVDGNGDYQTYQATLEPVNGSSSTLFDGYVTIEPKTVESVYHNRLILYQPKIGPVPAGPLKGIGEGRFVREIKPPGPVTDLALAPEGVRDPFLVKGSSKVYEADPITGAATPFATGPAGAGLLAYGGRRQTLFVAGRNGLVGLDGLGHAVARADLSAPLDALQYDTAHDRLVGVDAEKGTVRFFDTQLNPAGGFRFDPSTLSGDGPTSLAIASSGRLLLRRDGSSKVVSILPAVQRGARGRGNAARTRTFRLAVSPEARGLTVDDFGHMFVSLRGKLIELARDGSRVERSPYNGVPAGTSIDIARSFSNADSALRQQLDYLPPERQGPARPDLVLVPTTGNRFTVHNQGFDAAGPFKVTITNPGGRGVPPSTETYDFAGLAEGASVTQTYPCNSTSAPITVDPDNQVAESDESNNTGTTNACTAG